MQVQLEKPEYFILKYPHLHMTIQMTNDTYEQSWQFQVKLGMLKDLHFFWVTAMGNEFEDIH